MSLTRVSLILIFFIGNISAGNHVCYKKKIFIDGEKRYIGCSMEDTFCKRLGKRGFGGGYSKKKQKLAKWQCSTLTEREIKIITCRKNPNHHWCRSKALRKITRDSHNRIKINESLGRKMCKQGEDNCLTLGGTKSECSNWCR